MGTLDRGEGRLERRPPFCPDTGEDVRGGQRFPNSDRRSASQISSGSEA